jgi:hypothetical protein
VREIGTRHSLQEIVVYFARGPIGRHSVVYPLLQMFFAPLTGDLQRFVMHMNGVLGALACLPLYLFVRQRTGSRTAGVLCALFLAVHPVVARFSPTDGPYAFLVAAWFAGLALLSAPDVDGRGLFAGAALLGIAATCRVEGFLMLPASLLLLDVRALLAAAHRHLGGAALGLAALALLAAVQIYFVFPFHLQGPTPPSALIPDFAPLVADAVYPMVYNDPLFAALVLVGAAAGLSGAPYRVGAGAYAAMLLVLAPVVRSGDWILSMHRMVPTCALQTIAAGIGAWRISTWISALSAGRIPAVAPGAVAALVILARHRAELSEQYVFTHEYEIARTHLAPASKAADGCTLLTCNQIGEDVDIHDFGHVLPGMRVLDCRRDDCLSPVKDGGCFYYMRSAGCYFHFEGIPAPCEESGATPAGDRIACLNAPAASVERALSLEPVEMRSIDVLATFSDRRGRYPRTAEVGLFRVRPRADDSIPDSRR